MAGDRSVDLLFDVRHIRQSGIGTYIAAQLPGLSSTLAAHDLTLGLLADPDTAPPVDDATVIVPADPTGAGMYSADEQRAWNTALSTVRPRAIWFPHYPFPVALLRPANRRVMAFATVHDTLHLQPLDISGLSSLRRQYARVMNKLDAKRCTTIFSPSQATADRLARFAPGVNVQVTPIPVDPAWFAPTDPTLSPVDGRYLLYVGNVKWHKNLKLLLEAYARVAHEIPQRLVIAGSGDTVATRDTRIDTLAESLGGRVQVIGRLEFGALRALVAQADLLVMPSLHEGAGLPPLEAMASNTAVLASNIDSLRETCGDGADYFDPYDADELARLLRTYCCDDAARTRLAEAGSSHVRTRQTGISLTAAAETICTALTGNRG